MAAIKGLTDDQNASLASVEVGDLVLVHQIITRTRAESDSDSDSNDDNDDSDDDEDDSSSENEDEDDESSDSEDQSSDSDSATPRPAEVATDHAEHIEDMDRPNATSINNIAYRGLRTDATDRSSETDLPVTVYLILAVAKSSKGTIKDISLATLRYGMQADADVASFHLYGKECVASSRASHLADTSSHFDQSTKICDLPGGETLRFTVSPSGDIVRRIVMNHECPAGCDQGWLPCITQLSGMVKDYSIPSSQTNEPAVCPSCIGIDLMKEHQDLRAELEAFLRVSDIGIILTFHSRLMVRRRELGYDFEQFDERKWGYLFDDMVSDDGESGRDDGRYETWDEANDPSNGAILEPASDATIKSLPVKKYTEVKKEEDAQCVVCRETFEDDQLVMQLPCKHFFCEDGCTAQWLKQYDTCPVCRAKVPPVKEGDGNGDDDTQHEGGDAVSSSANGEQDEHDASFGRDDDVVMLDV